MAAEATSSGARPASVSWWVFGPCAVLAVVFAAWALLFPAAAHGAIVGAQNVIATWFGWWYLLLAAAVVAFVAFIAVSKYGRYRLGPDESRPEHSGLAWASMLFAAGIGIDLMYFSVAEPVAHFSAPPVAGGSVDATSREAVNWAIFHYGITGWAMYALMGAALGYFAFRRRSALAIGAVLAGLGGGRASYMRNHTVNVVGVLGTLFGIATSLGIGVVQLNFGLHEMFGVPSGHLAQIGLIALSVGITVASAFSRAGAVLRLMSQAAIAIAVALVVYVIVARDSTFVLNSTIQSIGDYVSTLPSRTLESFAWQRAGGGHRAESAEGFMRDWTLFFWAWWAAWAPFVGLFLARVSRGRTLRQFIAGVLLVPFGFVAVWIAVFGSASISAARGDSSFFARASAEPETGLYLLLQRYPGGWLLVGAATVVGLLFYVTSADSGALVMGNFTSHLHDPMDDCSRSVRVFWACAVAVLTSAMLFAGDGDGSIGTLQAATVVVGLPASILLALVAVALWRALHAEELKYAGARASLPGAVAAGRRGGPGANWRQRLRATTRYPGRAAALALLEETVVPALGQVCDELTRQKVPCVVDSLESSDGLTSPRLTVDCSPEPSFTYRICPVLATAPSYAVLAHRTQDRYVRCEVYLSEGSQGYTVNGYDRQQVIGDVLDHYERHLAYLHLLSTEANDAPTAD